jgi:hypothetical protein
MMNPTLTLIIVSLLAVFDPLAAQDEGVKKVRLFEPTLLNGVLCEKTDGFLDRRTATLHGSGSLESCALAQPTEVHGHTLPAGTWIHLRENGSLNYVWLGRNTVVQGHECRGSGYGSWQTTFHANGTLRTCWLVAPEVIDGIPCRHASFWGEIRGNTSAVFHDNGMLRSCQAAESFVRDGRNIHRGERVLVNQAGTIGQG